MKHVKTRVIMLLTAFIVMTSNLAICQEPTSPLISPGGRLRVSTTSHGTQTVEGTVTSFENGLLAHYPDSGKAPIRINMADVSRVELRTSESTRGKGAGWGALAGALGFLTLVAATDGCGGSDELISDEVCYGSAAVFGATVGALVGLAVSHGEEWEPMLLIDTGRQSTTGAGHQGQIAGHRRGLGLSLSVMF